jgi:hypothetical protein
VELDLVLRAVMLPAAVVAAVCLALVTSLRSMPMARAVPAVGTLLPVLVSLAAFRALAVQEGEHFLGGLAPGVSYGWIPTALLLAAVVAGVVGAGSSPLAVRAACIAAPAVAFSLLAPPGLRGGEPQAIAAAVAAAASACAVGAFGDLPRAGFAAWWLALSAASSFPIMAGFAKLGFVAAALAASVAALGTVSAFRRAVTCAPAMHVAMATALGCIAFVGMGYDEAPLPRWCWAAVALSPVGSAVASCLPRSVPSKVRTAAIVLAPAAVVAAALAAALPLSTEGDVDHDAYAVGGSMAAVP